MYSKHILSTRLAGLVAFAVLYGLASPQPALAQSATDDIEAEARASERLRRMRESDSLRTRQQIEGIAATAAETDSLLAQLEERVSKLLPRLEALRTNDEGKRLAKDNATVMHFIRIQEEQPIVPLDQIAARRKAIQQSRKMLDDELKRDSVGFVPPATIRREIEETRTWSKDRLAGVINEERWLEAALGKAPKDIDLKEAKTMDALVRDYYAEWVDLIEKARTRGEQAAAQETKERIEDAARTAKRERGIREAEQLLQQARAEIERLRIEHELELKQMRADLEKQVAEADTRYRDLVAQIERDRKLAAAERHSKDVDAQVKSENVYSESEKKQLMQRCKDPEVQRVLAPFLAPGYSQPGNSKGSFDKGPVSLSALRAFGALEPTTKGLEKLLSAGTDRKDKERPRWGFHPFLKRLDAKQRDELRSAQQMLVELGDVMVELGMLQP